MSDVPVPESTPGVLRIQALNYRSLRHVDQVLGPFHVLVGPNASGKSTFLDVVGLLGDLLRHGLQDAIAGDAVRGIPLRATDARHLTWMRREDRFELAVEMAIPAERRERLKNGGAERCRYEVAVDVSGPLRIIGETLWLKSAATPSAERAGQRMLFPQPEPAPESIVHPPNKQAPKRWKKAIAAKPVWIQECESSRSSRMATAMNRASFMGRFVCVSSFRGILAVSFSPRQVFINWAGATGSTALNLSAILSGSPPP